MLRLLTFSVIQSALLCLAQILLKQAMLTLQKFHFTLSFFHSLLTNWWLLCCGISFLFAGGLWVYMLKVFPFSQVYPLTSITYVFGVAAATWVFHEQVNSIQWLGVMLIMAGTALIAR